MKSSRSIFAVVPLAIALLPVGVYVADRQTSAEEIARNVTVSGVPVGGLTRSDATIAVESFENRLRTDTGVFSVNGMAFKLSPVAISLDADVPGAIDAAFLARRDGGVFVNFASWINSFSTSQDVPMDIAFDTEAIDRQIAVWEAEAIPNPAFNGGIQVVDGVIEREYPNAGQALDHDEARAQIVAEMSTLNKIGVALSVVDSTPSLASEDIDRAAEEMSDMIDSPITLTSVDIGFRTTFSPESLASAVRADLGENATTLIVSFDEGTVLEILDPRLPEYEINPVDARFDIDIETDTFVIIPGRSGTVLDNEELLTNMRTAALGPGTGVFPLIVGQEPAFTTEAAEAFTTLGPLAGFTTNHPANQPRVINIQKMADAVNGSIVLPGDDWSINDRVGIRSETKGYVAAPAIINGSPYCCDNPANIGGGVSQFGTTLFNAVFFSCLEDVEHRPHSLYFTRYPAGREATLGFPAPDVRFRNDTEFPVVIATAYTDTSITVKMYGDNGGLVCVDHTHEPEAIVEYETELVADTEDHLNPGQTEKIRSGINGFLIRVDRIVTYPDGRTEEDLNLVHRYRPLSEQYLVHRCEVSGEPVNCPVRLASVVNQTWEEALASLADVGLLAARITISVDSAAKDGIVVSQDPAVGEWVAAGTTVNLTVGVYP